MSVGWYSSKRGRSELNRATIVVVTKDANGGGGGGAGG